MSELSQSYDSKGNLDFSDFLLENGIMSYVLVSLMTNKSIEGESRDNAGSRLGLDTGSELWAELNQPFTSLLLTRVKNKAYNSLKWLIDEKIASSIDVKVDRLAQSGIRLTIKVTRSANNRFKQLWDNSISNKVKINPFGNTELLISLD